jgi:hypothetical protein
MRITATYGVTTVTMCQGYLDSITPSIGLVGIHTAELRGIGPLGYISQKKIHVEMKTNILTGAAITEILDRAGWPVGLRSLDAGKTTMARWWTGNVSAFDALRDVEETDSGFIRETRDGKIAFEDRHHRLITPHTVSQATYTDDPTGAIRYKPPQQIDPLRQVYNIFEVSVRKFEVGLLSILWTLSETGSDSPYIAQGQTKTFRATYPSGSAIGVGVAEWTTLVSVTDYTANAQADGLGADLTSQISVVLTKRDQVMDIALTNNASVTAYITKLQARGTPVEELDPVIITKSDSASITAYGERTYPGPGKFISDSLEAEQYCGFQLSIYKSPIPVLAMHISANRDANLMAEVLAREVSDRITVVATGDTDLGLNGDFFVERMTHTVSGGGTSHTVDMELSPVVAGYGSGFWIMGTSTIGIDTKLAY